MTEGVDRETEINRTKTGLPKRALAEQTPDWQPILTLTRSASIVILAILASRTSPMNVAIVVLLIVGAAIQPIVARFTSDAETRRAGFFWSDISLAVGVVVLAPVYFLPACIVLVATVSGYATAARARMYAWLAIVVPVLVFLLGSLAEVEHLELAVAATIAVSVVHGIIGQQMRESFLATRRQLDFAVGASGGMIHVTNLDHGVTHLEGDVYGVVGWSRRDWMTMDQFRVVHPDDHDAFHIDADQLVPGETIQRSGRVRTEDGRWVWLLDTSRVVDAGTHIELHGFTVDDTARKLGLEHVESEATTDALTGLPNRRALTKRLGELSDSTGHHLVLLDLDRFKDVNDTLGHDAGDALLRVVADRIVATVAKAGFVARLGGDEFAIVFLGELNTAFVQERVTVLAQALTRPMNISGVNVTTSASAGIARATEGSSVGSDMLRHADVAMYSAKRNGVTSVLFDRTMGAELERRAALSTQIGPALEAGQIKLHYQPIIDQRGNIVSVEGLARWEHPEMGLLTPDNFLDLILVSDWSGYFNRLMIEQAVQAAALVRRISSTVSVAVNVSVRTLEDEAFERWFLETCHRFGTELSSLVFEVAEQDLHHEIDTGDAIDRFAALGVGIAIDDFGTGYASFDRLRWQPVSQLKLDMGLVRHIDKSERDRLIVQHIVDLAHALGQEIVAEGVETLEQAHTLRDLQCELFQGHLFARPLPMVQLQRLLVTGPTPEAQAA